MSVQRSLNVISQQRVDVSDLRAIESAARNDFDQLIQGFVTGTSQGYILRGFEISMAGAIGGASNGLQLLVDPGAIFHIKSTQAGTVYMVPTGTPPQQLNSATNTIVDGAFVPNAINYVGLEYERFIDDTTSATVYLWDPVTNTETTKNAPRAVILRYRIKITTSVWASNVLPIAVVTTDAGNNVVSITDARWLLFRLGLGGASPNPFYKYPWDAQTEGRTESPSTSSSNGINPFHGGDKMLFTLKDWMNAVMTSLLEIKGTTYWYSSSSAGSIETLREDLANTVITGKGNISHDEDVAGKINWDQDIFLKVIGSRLAYKLVANPSTTDITLADNQVAYITFIRNVEVTPNLVFTNGSPTVTSVGSVSWTSSLIAGDYVKLGADTDQGYYQILSVDSLSQVTLTQNYNGSSTGAGGAKGKYAFGSYQTAAIPSTNRNIFISAREDVPDNADVFWLFLRADNGDPIPRVYVRFLGIELEQGESEQVSDTVPLQLLQYIGSPIETASKPKYVSALNPGSVPEITDLQCGSAATISSNQYFKINSSGNNRRYYVWFNKDGTGVDPAPSGYNASVMVAITTGQTAAQVATQLANALTASSYSDFTAVTRPVPNTDTVRVTNNSAGSTTDASNFNVGAPFNVNVIQQGTGLGNYLINDGDSLTLAIKKLDRGLNGSGANENQDRNLKLIEGGTWSFNLVSAAITERENNTAAVITGNARDINNASTFRIAQGFTAASSYTIDHVNLRLSKAGSPTGFIKVSIYTDVAGNPGVSLGSSSNINIATFASFTANTLVTATGFPTINIVNGTAYHIVIEPQAGNTIGGGNVIWINANASGSPGNFQRDLTGTGSWATFGGTFAYFDLYGVNAGGGSYQLINSANAYIDVPDVLRISNTILAQTILFPDADSVAYVEINRASAGTQNLTVTVADMDTFIPTNNSVVIARKVTAGILVGTHSFLLKPGEFLELDGALAEINRLLGQLRLTKDPNFPNKARISAADVILLNGDTLSQIIGSFILKFDGAVIEFDTGNVFQSDGTTPLGVNFTPFAVPTSQYFWYGISLIPSTVLGDNTQTAQVQIDLAASANASASAAPKSNISGQIKLGEVQVFNNAGTIQVFDVHRLGVGSGSGSGSGTVKATFLDPVSTTLPTGATVTIDGIAGANDDLVLFTNLSSGNNRIYKLSGVGTAIAWTAQRSFNSQFDPLAGDSVRVTKGNAFTEQLAVFDGTAFKVNDVIRLFDGVSGNFWELSSIKSNSINNNTTATVFSVAEAGSENMIITYSIARGSTKETGQIMLTTDGTNVRMNQGDAYIGSSGVTFSAVISTGNLVFSYTADNSGASGSMKYYVSRWSDSPGGPTGIPSYSGGGGGGSAGGANKQIQYNSSGVLAGDSRFNWDASGGFMTLGNLEYQALSGVITLNDNTASPASIFTYVAATYRFAIMEYSIVRNGAYRTGRCLIANDGTIAQLTDDDVETAVTGITLSAAISGANVSIQYTSSATGFNANFKYTIRRWS